LKAEKPTLQIFTSVLVQYQRGFLVQHSKSINTIYGRICLHNQNACENIGPAYYIHFTFLKPTAQIVQTHCV
ncbi:hypothetical protein CLOM_g23026, partial [Closterium sp. NIES-68]